MECNFRYSSVAGGCSAAVCEACGYSADCIKTLPLKRKCDQRRQAPGMAGTYLKVLLSRFGIKPSACRCNKRALHMNAMGNDWCEQNIETIVEWLKEEASARGLPFLRTVGRMLVRRAISNARREEERVKGTA